MAINLHCTECKRDHRLGTVMCSCGMRLKKFRVVVKLRGGKRVSRIVGDSLSLARKVEAKFKTMAVEGDVFKKANVGADVHDLWNRYITWAKSNKKTWRDDLSRWTHHVEPYIRNADISPKDVQAIIDRMTNHAPATQKQVLVLIRRVYNWSIKAGLYEGVNPGSRVATPRFDNTRTNPLTKEALTRLVQALDDYGNEPFRLFVLFALFSGKRRGELLGLRWSDVDLDTGMVTYRQTKSGYTQTLPLNETCKEILDAAKLLQDKLNLQDKPLCQRRY
jgi:integrase